MTIPATATTSRSPSSSSSPARDWMLRGNVWQKKLQHRSYHPSARSLSPVARRTNNKTKQETPDTVTSRDTPSPPVRPSIMQQSKEQEASSLLRPTIRSSTLGTLSAATTTTTPTSTTSNSNKCIPLTHISTLTTVFGPTVDLYHDVFQIAPSATQRDIRIAYFQQGRKCHLISNENQNKNTDQLFQAVSMAYEVLSNPHWKQQYDGARGGVNNNKRNAWPKLMQQALLLEQQQQPPKKQSLLQPPSRSLLKKDNEDPHKLKPTTTSSIRWNEHVQELLYRPDPSEQALKRYQPNAEHQQLLQERHQQSQQQQHAAVVVDEETFSHGTAVPQPTAAVRNSNSAVPAQDKMDNGDDNKDSLVRDLFASLTQPPPPQVTGRRRSNSTGSSTLLPQRLQSSHDAHLHKTSVRQAFAAAPLESYNHKDDSLSSTSFVVHDIDDAEFPQQVITIAAPRKQQPSVQSETSSLTAATVATRGLSTSRLSMVEKLLEGLPSVQEEEQLQQNESFGVYGQGMTSFENLSVDASAETPTMANSVVSLNEILGPRKPKKEKLISSKDGPGLFPPILGGNDDDDTKPNTTTTRQQQQQDYDFMQSVNSYMASLSTQVSQWKNQVDQLGTQVTTNLEQVNVAVLQSMYSIKPKDSDDKATSSSRNTISPSLTF